MSSGRTTDAIGSPRRPAASAPSSQLPKWADRSTTPLPRRRAASRFSTPSYRTRAARSSGVQRETSRNSKNAAPRFRSESRAIRRSSACVFSGNARARFSSRMRRRRGAMRSTSGAASRPKRAPVPRGRRRSVPAMARNAACSIAWRTGEPRRRRVRRASASVPSSKTAEGEVLIPPRGPRRRERSGRRGTGKTPARRPRPRAGSRRSALWSAPRASPRPSPS